MGSKEANNCWEFHDCPKEVKEKCPSYQTDMGRECWLIASSYQIENCPGRSKNMTKECCYCPWFKKMNPET